MNINYKEISIKEYHKILGMVSRSRESSIHIFGDSGIGKTEISRQYFKNNNIEFLDIQLSAMNKDSIKKMIENFFKGKRKNSKYGLILNELNHLSREMMATLYELIDNKKMDEFILPEKTMIIATSNHINDSEVNKKLLGPLSNRFITFNLTQSLEDFLEYANARNYHKSIISFIKLNPHCISQGIQHHYNDINYPSPRNWKRINEIIQSMDRNDSNEFNAKIVYSLLGKIIGSMYFDILENREIKYISLKNLNSFFDEKLNIKDSELFDFEDVLFQDQEKVRELVEQIEFIEKPIPKKTLGMKLDTFIGKFSK